MKSSRPLGKRELAGLKPVPATEPVPKRFGGLSDAAIRFSLPEGEGPRVEAVAMGSVPGRTLWQIRLGGNAGWNWPGQAVHHRKKPGRAPTVPTDGHRPPWMDLHYSPALRELPSLRRNRLGRMVRPAEGLHLLRDNGYPWACVGLITNSDGATGSGSLVGARLVLTASHCVPWQSVHSGKGWWMTFTPNQRSLDFNPAPFGQSNVSDVLSYREVPEAPAPHDSFDTGEDYAVLRLFDPLGERVGWFGSTDYDEDWNDLNVWAAVGYPAGVGPFAETEQSIVDGDSPGVVGQGAGLDLETHAEIQAGMSGGPFWAWFDVGNGNRTPRITGVISSTGDSNWLGGGSEMVALVEDGRSRWA